MKAGRGLALVACGAGFACWCGGAQAYRPFDGTDAAVADTGKVEIELGPAEYLKQGPERTLFAPSARFNYGFAPGWEAVVEGRVAHAISDGVRGTSPTGNGAFLKSVLREGSLQEKSGPSIATEFGVLLPGHPRRPRHRRRSRRYRLPAVGMGNRASERCGIGNPAAARRSFRERDPRRTACLARASGGRNLR